VPRGVPLTEEERHEKALDAALMHLERGDGKTHCGLWKAGGLGWVTDDEGEFDDRASYRCKRCEKAWLREKAEELAEWNSPEAQARREAGF
jgi:transposase-like protein